MLLLISAVYIYTASGLAIMDDGDALYAEAARGMARSGDYVTPYVNGVRFLDKPPMMYWMTAAGYLAFGYNEFAAHLPSALAVLATGLLLFRMGARSGDPQAGFIAGAAYAFCIGTFLFTRLVFPDAVFVFFLTLSVLSFLEWYLNGRNTLVPSLLFYASTAGAVLAKGLIGVVFPAAVILLFLIWMKDLRRLRHFHLFKGSILFLVLAVPWHFLAAQRNPGFLWYYFINEQFLRFAGKRQPADYSSIPLLVFWALVLLWLFPWSAFIPAIRHVVGDSERKPSGARAVARLCLCWIVFVLVFFSFSSRIEHYALPIFPPLMALAGMALSAARLNEPRSDSPLRRSVSRGFAFLGILGAAAALVLLVSILFLDEWFSRYATAETARLHAYKHYFAPLFEMPPGIISELKIPFYGTCAAIAAGLLGSWWANRRGLRLIGVVILNLMMGAFCLFTVQSFGICEEMISSRQFGEKLNELYCPGDSAVVAGDYETANSIAFYSPFSLQVYQGTAALLHWGMQYPDAPPITLSTEELKDQWAGPQRVFLLAPEDKIPAQSLAPLFEVMRSAGRVLLSNRDPAIRGNRYRARSGPHGSGEAESRRQEDPGTSAVLHSRRLADGLRKASGVSPGPITELMLKTGGSRHAYGRKPDPTIRWFPSGRG